MFMVLVSFEFLSEMVKPHFKKNRDQIYLTVQNKKRLNKLSNFSYIKTYRIKYSLQLNPN